MTMNGAQLAVTVLRQAGLAPTRRRLVVAGLVFDGPGMAVDGEELRERAAEAGLCLGAAEAERALAELRGAGALPERAGTVPAAPDLADCARLLQAMGNPCRLAVLRELAGGERGVGHLLKMVPMQQSALSQHLARLRADGLVRCRRQGTRVYYSLVDPAAAAVLRALAPPVAA